MDFINDTQKSKRPELLAPAGTMDSLLAALGAGADAVYLGLDVLNARSNAGNFSLDTLPQACAYAHAHNARVYLTVNVVILPHEMQQAVELIEDAWECGIDAVIIQDLGLIKVLSDVMPQVAIHASTQMNIHSAESVRALARYGVKRVTLARETSMREIETLVAVGAECGIEIESFVHGAICVCYSGQCFLSSFIGRRSANRGQCAQPCRLPYELVDKYDEVQEAPGKHLLSPKDLAGIEKIGEFINAGVASLKIEGRMKSPSYVAAVVSVYRHALDNDGQMGDVQEAYDQLSEAFSRGFTTAYLDNRRDNDIMSYTRPNNRGTLVGRISGFEGADALIAFEKDISSQDTIEVWTNKGRFAQEVGSLFVEDSEQDHCPAGKQALVYLSSRASVGDRVFRVRSSELSNQAVAAIEEARARTIDLDFDVAIHKDAPLSLTVRDDQGFSGSAQGPVVEAARTKALTRDDAVEHINRLGNTLFKMRSISMELDEGVGLGFSALHNVRRDALADYEKNRFYHGEARVAERPYLPPLKKKKKSQLGEQHVDVVAVTESLGGAKAALNAGASYACVAAYNLANEEPLDGIWPILPRVAHDSEIDTYIGIAERFGRAQCSTLGQLKACAYRKIPAQAHWSLNATNAYTVNAIAEMGAQFVWLSPELSGKQIASIARQSSVPVGIAVAGLTEVMVTEHCILMSMGPCAQNCVDCTRRKEVLALRDRKDYHFRVMTDVTGRSHIFNSVPLDLTDALEEIIDAGVGGIRLDLETALTSSVSHEVAVVRGALTDTLAGREVPKVDTSLTRGHFYRGVV